MHGVIAKLLPDVREYQQAGGEPYGKPKYIDEAEVPVAEDIPKGDREEAS